MNPSNPLVPCYTANPIKNLGALGKALGFSVETLMNVAQRADSLYRPGPPQQKPDGTVRETLVAKTPLYEIHQRIYSRILKRFYFPDYLTGSLPGRDQKMNAERHAGATLLVTADIRKFFPSTKPEIIASIFRDLARFGPEVADCLARLVTKDGGLPQGASTSPALANLALWSLEPRLVAGLNQQDFIYTRFVDDISISSRKRVPPDTKTQWIAQICGMLGRLGYRSHRKKQHIFGAGQQMITTKLTTNKKPGLTTQVRSQIRAAVHEQEQAGNRPSRSSPNSVKGRVSRLGRFHPGKAAALKKRLGAIDVNADS